MDVYGWGEPVWAPGSGREGSRSGLEAQADIYRPRHKMVQRTPLPFNGFARMMSSEKEFICGGASEPRRLPLLLDCSSQNSREAGWPAKVRGSRGAGIACWTFAGSPNGWEVEKNIVGTEIY